MDRSTYSHLLNFAWYQLLWFTAVLAGTTLSWLLAVLLLLHLLHVRNWRSELRLMGMTALVGCSVDGALALAGLYVFGPPPQLLPIPLWLVAIWLGFAGTLRHSLGWLSARPRLMTVFAGVGAPMTYLAAGHLGAVSFPLGNGPTALVIGLAWVAMTPLLCRLAANARRTELTPLNELQPFLTREIEK